ncbi:MAG TPA: DMT family transporter [Aggregatilineales bacterium]|nr:DMT family transporter [Aggregatilineales bacterium]
MTKTASGSSFRALVMLIIGVSALSMAAVFIRLAQEESIPSLVIAGGRLLIATTLLIPIIIRRADYRAQIRHISRRDLLLITIGGVFLSLHFATWISSLEYTSVLISGVLVTTTPIWVALLERFVLKSHLSAGVMIGLAVALVGGMIIATPSGGSITAPTANNPLLGGFLALAGAWAVAVYLIVGRKMRGGMSLTPYIFMVYGIGALTTMLIILFTGTPVSGFSSAGYGWVVLVAVMPQLIGHSSLNYALAYLPATIVSLSTQTEPILSAIGAYLVFGELPSSIQAIGGAIILVGVVFATISNKRTDA